MAWTYDDSQLATSTLMQVRLEIGDTNSGAPLLQDEEIQYALSLESNYVGASARCCEIISRQLLRKADVRIGRGGTTLNYAVAANQYQTMALALRKRANAMNAPWAGGTSKDAKESQAADTDAVQPIFTKTLGTNPRVGGERSDTLLDDQHNV